jgi:hypothetical protein
MEQVLFWNLYSPVVPDTQWRVGTISEETSSTQLHVVCNFGTSLIIVLNFSIQIKDNDTGEEENINAEYIREKK